MKNKIPDIDLNRYTDLEDMYGYVGFVDEEGGFYRVRKIGSGDGGHGEWAYFFLDSIKKQTGHSPSLKFFQNIHFLMRDPRFKMSILYEISDVSTGDNSKITYSTSVRDMPDKQKEVINNLIEYQDKKYELFQNRNYKSM